MLLMAGSDIRATGGSRQCTFSTLFEVNYCGGIAQYAER